MLEIAVVCVVWLVSFRLFRPHLWVDDHRHEKDHRHREEVVDFEVVEVLAYTRRRFLHEGEWYGIVRRVEYARTT